MVLKFVKVRNSSSKGIFDILSFQSLLNGWIGPLGPNVHQLVGVGPLVSRKGLFHLGGMEPKKDLLDLMRDQRDARLTQFLTGRHALCLPCWATGQSGLHAKRNVSMRAPLAR